MGTKDTDKIYIVLSGGEHISDIAKKEGYEPIDLMLHNNLSPSNPSHYTLPEGHELHLPFARQKDIHTDRYEYTIWEQPRRFYINKEGGCRKYAFGKVAVHTDIFAVGGTNKQYKVVDIAGLVTITFSEDRIYAYYIETVDIKDDKVKHTIGYPKEYLTEGEAPLPAELHPTMDGVKELLESVGDTVGLVEPIIDDKTADLLAAEDDSTPAVPLPVGTTWRASYEPLPNGPTWFKTKLACDVIDYGGRRPIKSHWYGQVLVGGTFTIGKNVYGRPQTSVDNGNWYGIERWNLEELRPLDPTDKAGQLYEVTDLDPKRFKVYETALFTPIAKTVAQGVRVVDYAKNKVKGKIIQ